MALSCEVCSSPLRDEDVRHDLGLARCAACNSVYDLSERKARRNSPPTHKTAPQPAPRVRPQVELPRQFKLEEQEGRTVLSFRWLNGGELFGVILLGQAGVGVLFSAYTTVQNSIRYGKALEPAGLLLYLGMFLCIAYVVGAGLLNRVFFEVRDGEATLRKGPLPWPGTRTLSSQEISQLYGKAVTSRGKKNRVYTTYSLMAQTRSGKTVQLLSGLPEVEQVLYLERTLEQRLGIEDKAMPGENTVTGIVRA